MRIATKLYQQFQSLVHELAKFGVVGAVGFVMNYAITNLLRFGVGLGPLTSNVYATVATTTFAYFANRYWTFRHREQSGLGREYFLFFVFNGIGLLIQILCIGFASYTLELEGPIAYNAALTAGVVGGTLFRYWSYKKWVFLPPSLPPVDPHTGLPEVPRDQPAAGAAPAVEAAPATNDTDLVGSTTTAAPHGENGTAGSAPPVTGPDRMERFVAGRTDAAEGNGSGQGVNGRHNGVRPTTRGR